MTALKTVAMRIRGTSTEEMEEEGLETDGMVESKSKLRGKIKGLSGVDILTDSGAYKSTYQILSDISDVWEDMNDMDQAALLELLAGKRAGSVMSAILQNPETLKDAFESANDAAGSAWTENEKYMNSIQGKLDLFSNSLQTMWNNELNSGTIKWFVSLGEVLIKVIDKIGLLSTALIVLMTYLKIHSKQSWGGFFASIGTSVAALNTKLTNLTTRFGLLNTVAKSTKTSMQGVTVEMFKQKLAATGVSAENQKLILSKMGLAKANADQLVGSKALIMSTLQEAIANKTLTATQAIATAQKLGIIKVTKGLNVANASTILQLMGVDRQQRKNIISSLGLSMQTKKLTKDEIMNALAKQGITDAAKQEMIANEMLRVSQGKLLFSLKSLGNGIKNFISKNGMLITIAAIAGAIYGVIKIFDSWITTIEETKEQLTELNSDLETTESKLEDLNSQLKETQDRIKELNEQESLTFTEQEELDKLRAQSAELEAQIDLTEQLRASQQKKVNDKALSVAKQYEKANFKSGKSKGEYMETGANVGAITAGIAGAGAGAIVGSSVIAGATVLGTTIAPGVGTAIGAIIGGIIAAFVGAGIGTGVGAGVAEAKNQVGEAMDHMLEERKKLEEEYNKAHIEYAKDSSEDNRKKYEEAEKAFSEYDAMMAKHLTELDSYYSQIDLSVYDPTIDKQKIEELRKEINNFYDTQDKWAIANGGQDAKYNAITRIFGENASDELKDVKKAFEDAAKEGKEISLKEAFDTAGLSTADLDMFITRLREMGIYVYETENYFHDLIDAEEDAAKVSLYGVVTDINKVTEGLESLKSAFEEVIENSSVSAKTLAELNEVFGTLGDSWDNYVNTMFSGTSSTKKMQKATEDLAKAFIDSKILTGEAISEYERMTYIIQLRNIGVENAEEYVNAKIQESAYKAIQNSADYNWGDVESKYNAEKGADWKSWDEMTDEERRSYADWRNFTKDISAEKAQEIADTYGVEIDNLNEVIDLLEQKANKEAEVADVKSAQDHYQSWVDDYNKTKEDIEQFEKQLSQFSEKAKNFDSSNYYMRSGTRFEKGTNKFISENEYRQLEAESNAYKNWLRQNSTAYEAYLNNKKKLEDLKNSEEGKKWLNEDGTLKEGVDAEFEAAYKAAQDGVDKLEKELNAEVELKLEVQKSSEVVDKIQETYDTLRDAAEEYSENKYLSVDTMQSLLELEPKYLAMLYNEKGQLDLNKNAILQVAKARLFDTTQKQIDSIITNASNAAKNGEIDKLNELTDVLYDAADAQSTFNTTKMQELKLNLANPDLGLSTEEQDSYYNKVKSQVNAVISTYNKTTSNLSESLSSSSSSGSDSDKKTALEKIQEKYERKINNLDAQQTYLQNEVDRLEAQNKGVSKQYYEDQIGIEQKKLALYQQERKELLKLKRTDEVADALWETEHAIQESTMRMVEFRKAIAELYKTAFDNIGKAFDDKDSLIEDRKAYIEGYAELLELQDKLPSASLYDGLIAQEEKDKKNNVKKLAALQAQYDRAVKGGILKTDPEAAREMEADLRATEKAIQDNDIAIAQFNEDLKNLYMEGWDKVVEAFDNKDFFFEQQQNFAEAYISRLEALNINVPDDAYAELIQIQELRNSTNRDELTWARGELEGIGKKFGTDSDEYIEKAKEVAEKELEVYEGETQILEWQQEIIHNQLDRFNQVVDRINNSIGELQNIADLIADEDVATEDGEWTAEGWTRLGVEYQQMKYNKGLIKDYNEQIDKLTKAYKNGEISEKEYSEQLQELEDGQWDAIKAYKDSEDAIIDLHEARIDMIEEGIDKEIDAMSELIDLKKEELDAERDLYDFRKDIQKQTKDIAALERRIASMSGSTDAATIAERTKLEAELREAKENLDDSYYDHAMGSQADALDDEMEAFEKSHSDYLEKLREEIKETDKVIKQTQQDVMTNAETVLSEINRLSGEYGITIDPNLTNPWKNATTAGVQGFANAVNTHMVGIQTVVNNAATPLEAALRQPWNLPDEENPLLTYSTKVKKTINGAVTKAQDMYKDMKTNLNKPWEDATAYNTWGSGVESTLNSAIKKAKKAGEAIEKAINVKPPSYVGNGSGDGGNGGGNGGGGNGGGGGGTPPPQIDTSENIKALQKILNDVFGAKLTVDGKWGNKTKNALTKAQENMRQFLNYYTRGTTMNVTGKFDTQTRNGMLVYFDQMAVRAENNDHPEAAKIYTNAKKNLPIAFHAKGTLGTTKDELAIDSEPWLGDELVLVPTASGNLSYMRKGTGVLTADLTRELMNIASLGVDGLTRPKFDSGINMVSNVISKPELNISFDSMVHVDHCDEGTLKDLEKMVDTKINQFNKQLNQSLRRFK